MKQPIILFICLLLLNFSKISSKESATENNFSSEDSIKIFSSPDLQILSVKLANEYGRLYPETKIKVVTLSNSKVADNLQGKGNIGFVSADFFSGTEDESLWKVIIGRSVIVPVINSKNPFLDEILQRGISAEIFNRFLSDPDSQKWGTLLNDKQNFKANYYRINDNSIMTSLSQFVKTDKLKTAGTEVESGEEMISAIKKDPYAIGFCKMINIPDLNKQTNDESVRLLPIDKNGNGKIDYNENIYTDINSLTRGVWIGKYPKTLITNIYSVSADQPKSVAESAFLKWVLTDGQQFLYPGGYSDLLASERQTSADKLYSAKINSVSYINNNPLYTKLLLIAMPFVLFFVLLNIASRYRKNKIIQVPVAGFGSKRALGENSLIIPNGLYFDKTHTWAFMEQNGLVKVGMDDFLQHITGTITRIKMKNAGDTFKKGEEILSVIRCGKQLNLYAPVSGIIREKNKALDTNASIINSSPYNDGWVYRIEPTNWLRENQLLFMAEKQKQFIKNEFSRLKDFLAVALKSDDNKYAQVVLQDGGELIDGALSDLGPEIWEDFQSKFIDPSRQIWFYELF